MNNNIRTYQFITDGIEIKYYSKFKIGSYKNFEALNSALNLKHGRHHDIKSYQQYKNALNSNLYIIKLIKEA